MNNPEYFSQKDQQRNDIDRLRRELVTEFKNTTDLFEQCRIAQNFEELCEEEEALLHRRTARRISEWMN